VFSGSRKVLSEAAAIQEYSLRENNVVNLFGKNACCGNICIKNGSGNISIKNGSTPTCRQISDVLLLKLRFGLKSVK